MFILKARVLSGFLVPRVPPDTCGCPVGVSASTCGHTLLPRAMPGVSRALESCSPEVDFHIIYFELGLCSPEKK